MSRLGELLDSGELSDIFKDFVQMTGLGVSLRDTYGNNLLSYYREDRPCACKIFENEEMCRKSIRFSGNKSGELGEPYIYICGCGLVMSASAIMPEGKVIGSVLCGPALLWEADEYAYDEIREKTSQVRELTEEEREKIVAGTPEYSCEEMTGTSRILFKLVNYMCRTNGDIIRQRREITEQQAMISDLVAAGKKSAFFGINRRKGFYSAENEKKLLVSVRLGDIAGARKQLNAVLAEIFLNSGGSIERMKARIFELTGFLMRACSECGVSGDILLAASENMNRIFGRESGFEDLCYYTGEMLEKVMDGIYKSHGNLTGGRYLSGACEFVNSHYSECISIRETAESVRISPSYLSHLYKDGLGITFTEYLSGVRIDAAKEMLRYAEKSVSEVAAAVGFDDTSYFTRIFKRYVGVSPKQYQKY